MRVADVVACSSIWDLSLAHPVAVGLSLGHWGRQEVFTEAAERVKQLKEASNADRLCLYGYFKQSTIGDVNIRTFPVSFCLLAGPLWVVGDKNDTVCSMSPFPPIAVTGGRDS